MKTYITTKDLDITSLYNEYIKELTVFMIETANEDMCLAYEENKKNPLTYDFNRTIIVVDRNYNYELICETIN